MEEKVLTGRNSGRLTAVRQIDWLFNMLQTSISIFFLNSRDKDETRRQSSHALATMDEDFKDKADCTQVATGFGRHLTLGDDDQLPRD